MSYNLLYINYINNKSRITPGFVILINRKAQFLDYSPDQPSIHQLFDLHYVHLPRLILFLHFPFFTFWVSLS
jgi:hypothetical protein